MLVSSSLYMYSAHTNPTEQSYVTYVEKTMVEIKHQDQDIIQTSPDKVYYGIYITLMLELQIYMLLVFENKHRGIYYSDSTMQTKISS